MLLALTFMLAAVPDARAQDAKLSALTITHGNPPVTVELTPAFDPDVPRPNYTNGYQASVGNDVEMVTVTATPADPSYTLDYALGASFTDADPNTPGHQVALRVGVNALNVGVTPPTGSSLDYGSYAVQLTRESDVSPCRLEPHDIWCANVRIVPIESFGTVFGSVAEWSEDDFTYEGRNHKFRAMSVSNGTLRVTLYTPPLTPLHKRDLVLHVGDTQLSFLAATQRGSPIYTWQNTGLDWSTTTSLTLRLRAPTPQPLYVGGTRSELTRLNHERVFATESLPANTDYRISVTGAAIRYRVVVTNAGGDELVDKVIHGTGDLPTTKTFTTGASGGVHQIRISNGDTGSLSNQYVSGWMAVIFLPMGVDETLNQRVSVGSRYSATFTVYGDTDQFTAEFAAGNRYVIEVHGRDEDRRLQPERTAWTPRFPDITKPMTRDGSTFDVQHNPEKWWVDGVSKKVEFSRTTPGPVGPVTHRYKEYQAVVVDLTDEDDQQHAGTWRLRVQPTQRRPDGIRTYRVGTYQVEVRELPASAGATEALTASFEDLPEAHDGESPFTVRLAFNFAVTVSAEAMRDDALTVTGGAVTGARLADGHDDRWEIEVTPASHGEVTITAPGGRACDEPGALCTASGQTLGADASATVAGPPVEQLTATFEGVPDTHDGETAFGFRIAFSEDVATSAEAMRDHALTVTGGTVTDAARVDARDDLWSVTVSPSGADDIEIELPPGRACTETGAICTPEGRELSTGLIQFVLADVENGGGPALTAAFEDVPAEHDGESAFRFRAAFSEDIGISYRALREDAFTVAGGHVTRGRRVDDRRDLFEITVQPDSDEAVTITLPGGRDCATSGAICTKGENRRQLTNSPSATVAGPTEQRSTNSPATGAPAISGTPQVGETLSASTSGISDADGLENADFAYQWIRGNSDIGGGTGSTYTAVDTDEGERLRVRVSFTDDAGNEESLTSAATEAVAAAPEPLTASFSSMPAEHRGEGNFKFRAAFSDEIKISYTTMRDTSFTVTNGDITKARRVDGRRDLWEMTVEPDSHAAVTIRLPETHDCDASGAVCTADGRPLSHSLSATVTGPVGISVADARVDENAGAVLAFAVTLTRAASGTVTVDYATENGSATAGNDYTAASGTLTFRSGESSKTLEVTVLDDSHDEGEETLTLRLSNASGGRVADGEARGTIVNRDPLPRALLARFGRTAAVHVVEHVEERMEAPREPGFEGRLAGRELRRGMERDMALNFLSQLGGAAGGQAPGGGVHGPIARPGVAGTTRFGTPGVGGSVEMPGAAGAIGANPGMTSGAPGAMGGAPGPGGGILDSGLYAMGLGGDSLLTGSSFSLNRETGRGGILSFWSRGARSSFHGREGALALGGDVRTTMFGADYAKGPLVVGLSLARSQGLGDYAGTDSGQVASAVTGLYPWLGYKLNERVSVWGVTGYGAGGMLLTPEGGPALESGLSMKMTATGTRGELVAGGRDGFGLAFKADALWVGTATEGVDGPAGRMAATEAAVSRVRTALEGSRGYTFGRGLSLKPSVEVGVRHDAGDAEQGSGMDVGGGLVVSDPVTGLAVDVRVRMLLVHEAEDFRERGVSVSLSYNPTPQTPLGLTAKVAPSWGGQAQSGAEALWGRDTMAGMAHGGLASGNRLDGEVGYGLPVGSRFVGTPRVGFTTSEYGRDYRVGYTLGALENDKLTFQLGVDAQRRESPMLGGTSNGLLGRASVGW